MADSKSTKPWEMEWKVTEATAPWEGNYNVIQPDVYPGMPKSAQTFMSAVEGGAHGVTAGLNDYLTAGMATVTDKFLRSGNYGTKLSLADTFNEMLKHTRARREEVQSQNPTAYTSGNVAGNVYTGLRTGGSSLIGTAAAQGTQGAVNKYTESPETTFADAAEAGAYQAALSGGLGVAGKGVGWVANRATEKLAQQLADEAGVSLAEARQMMKANVGEPGTFDVAKGVARDLGKIVAGSIGGSYVGSKVAPVFGVSPDTGERIGAEVGGGYFTLRALQHNLFNNAYSGLRDIAGFGNSAYPNAIPKATVFAAKTPSATVSLPDGGTASAKPISIPKDKKPWEMDWVVD